MKKKSHVNEIWGETKETITFAVSFRVYLLLQGPPEGDQGYTQSIYF